VNSRKNIINYTKNYIVSQNITMNKKKLIIILIVLILIAFFTISSLIGYTENRFVISLKEKVPYSLRIFLKKNVFFIADIRAQIEELKRSQKLENFYLRQIDSELRNQSIEIRNYLNFLSKQISEDGYKLPRSNKQKNISSKNGNYKYAFKKYFYTAMPWRFSFKPSGYLGIHGENIIVVSGSGEVIYFNSNDLNNDYLNTKIIENNLLQIINDPRLTKKGGISIKGILINNNNIFLSYAKKVKANCYNTSILKSEFNINKLEFKNFLSYKECSENYGNFTGGKMIKYNNDNFLFTMGSAGLLKQVQNDDSMFGKLFLVNFNDASYKLIAKGLRNAQGLFYYDKDDVVLLTEHGPIGGDEINAIFQNEIEKKINFGWPTSTYGQITYKNKYNNHKKHGFKEPIKYFSPSIAPSNIINVNEFGKDFKNDFFLSAMGSLDGPGRKSIHHYKFDKKYKKTVFEDQIKIGERIRDIIYLSDKNKVLMILDNSPAIAVLQFVN